jgi:hypothetical protein
MIEIGHWVGQYKFYKEAHQKMSGFESTNFEIEITKVDNNNFIGKVQDDLSTGGTEGIGEIIGKVTGEKIEFFKQMPIMTLLIGKDGTRKTLNKKHRKIYYQGIFSSDRKSISGHWRFKFGFIWFGLIPIPVNPTKGTWTMKLKE